MIDLGSGVQIDLNDVHGYGWHRTGVNSATLTINMKDGRKHILLAPPKPGDPDPRDIADAIVEHMLGDE
jgi:hypothetical protein